MQIKSVNAPAFSQYGFVVEGYNWSELTSKLIEVSEKPQDRVIYVPGDEALEDLPIAGEIQNRLFGGMPIQIGYCNGHNRRMGCLEYHRGSEVCVAADDIVLLLAPLQKVSGHKISSSEVEAFFVPAGTAVLLYETTLHYAPCTADSGDGFRVAIILSRGTNHAKPEITEGGSEDKLLLATNKWLIAHQDTPEAAAGAWAGIVGNDIVL